MNDGHGTLIVWNSWNVIGELVFLHVYQISQHAENAWLKYTRIDRYAHL